MIFDNNENFIEVKLIIKVTNCREYSKSNKWISNKQTSKQINRQTKRQRGRQTDRQKNRETDTDRKKYRQTSR